MANYTNMSAGRIYIDAGKSLYCCLYSTEYDNIPAIVTLEYAISYDSDICFIGSQDECEKYLLTQ